MLSPHGRCNGWDGRRFIRYTHANVNQENDAYLVIEKSNVDNDLSKVIKEACI